VWKEDAFPFQRTALFGSFPSDVVAFDDTVFATDADQIEAGGCFVVPVDVLGASPVASSRYAITQVLPGHLVDSAGNPGDASNPIGFGFYANDLLVAKRHLGFLLASAGGSDSVPALSDVVVFDPATGAVRQTVALTNPVTVPGAVDSSGTPVPPAGFVQAGAEGIAYVPTAPGKGLLFVAMSNFLFGAPSYGAVKYPGTVQIYDVDDALASPVTPIPAPGFATRTIVTGGFNAVAVTRLPNLAGNDRLLVTCAGTSTYGPSGLVPNTPASVEAYDAPTLSFLGSFDLGLAALSAARPAVGNDVVGHTVAFFASSVNGEAYLLRLDGLLGPWVDASRVAVLRGPNNGIPVDPAAAGGPGGNVAGVALSATGDVLLLSGFGDLFAYPTPKPGRLLALSLPPDLVGSPFFPVSFVPGTTSLVSTPGRTLGSIAIAAGGGTGPEIWVAVGGAIDLSTYLGAGPASLGSLATFGRVR
jgi:hypothetical protein